MKNTVIQAEEPFRTKLHPRWLPREMTEPPVLDPQQPAGAIAPRTALLIKCKKSKNK